MTKVSVFVDKDLRSVLKIQAARLGYRGVSEMVAAVFSCAVCKEPLLSAPRLYKKAAGKETVAAFVCPKH